MYLGTLGCVLSSYSSGTRLVLLLFHLWLISDWLILFSCDTTLNKLILTEKCFVGIYCHFLYSQNLQKICSCEVWFLNTSNLWTDDQKKINKKLNVWKIYAFETSQVTVLHTQGQVVYHNYFLLSTLIHTRYLNCRMRINMLKIFQKFQTLNYKIERK